MNPVTAENDQEILERAIQKFFKDKIKEVIVCFSVSEITAKGFFLKVVEVITRIYPAVE